MFGRISFWLKNRFVAFRRMFLKNKIHSAVFLVAAFAGLLSALASVEEFGETASLASKISEGSFNYFFFFLKVMIIPGIFLCISAVLTFNPVVFLLNYPIIYLFSLLFWKTVFRALCFDLGGIIGLLLLYIPLFVINLFIYLIYFLVLLDNSVNSCSWKYVTPLKCNAGFLLNNLKKFYLRCLCWNLAFTVAVVLIMIIFF